MTDRLSSETVHATAVALDGRAVLLLGPSGAGKSDLALRLFDRGFGLVSDDQTIVRKDGKRLLAAAPATIAGKFEVRGIGIVDMAYETDVQIVLAAELTDQISRMPEEGRERRFLGIGVPMVSIDAMTASAPAKVALALERLGEK